MEKGKKKDATEVVEIMEVRQGKIDCFILGRSPLIMNRLSEKTKHELLMPEKKTAGTKASRLKHNPFIEFRDSMHLSKDPNAPTRLLMPSTSFKGAMRSVAIDIPGAAKAQIGRLTYVESEYIPTFGIPQLFMSPVRSSDINRTPDIRTRAILPEWACKITVTYVVPLLREKDVANLLAAAGIMRGVGDWRTEKGSGNFGGFELVSSNDERWNYIVKNMGQVEQSKAVDDPVCYEGETAELLGWFVEEADRRGHKITT